MADKKNIVIKVTYPTAGKLSDADISPPKTITEWNFKRIFIALTGVALILTWLFYPKSEDSQNTELSKAEVVTSITNNPSSTPAVQVKSPVIRAVLTYKVIDNEPTGEIVSPLKISKKGSTSIYFFAELAGMKDKTVYHEWLLDGKLISRKKVNITGDTWRTSSRQSFYYTSENDWTVRLVQESGDIITEKQFNVIYE